MGGTNLTDHGGAIWTQLRGCLRAGSLSRPTVPGRGVSDSYTFPTGLSDSTPFATHSYSSSTVNSGQLKASHCKCHWGKKPCVCWIFQRFQGVARGGVEPPTFRFSVGRSYQLSYLAEWAA